MNDPWDVKSVRQPNQYVSCLKINGVPILPPVLSRECRKEMQYYKLLAKEVEKRISNLRPFVTSDTDSCDDRTDAPELPEYEQTYILPKDEIEAGFDVNIDKITAITTEKTIDTPYKLTESYPVTTDIYQSITSNVTVKTIDASSLIDSPKFVIDLSVSINETGKNILETIKKIPQRSNSPPSPPLELPERDCDYDNRPEKELLTDVETVGTNKTKELIRDVINFKYKLDDKCLSDPFPDIPLRSDGPSSLSSKSFTGSLQDIHAESARDAVPKLIRQRSYTVLKPSPQLLAHLEVQSLNTGVEVSSISMSESLSNISSPNKKRRSWDLETAKMKWSHMALELKHASLTGTVKTRTNSNSTNNVSPNNNGQNAKPVFNKAATKVLARARSVAPDNRIRRSSLNTKTSPKSEMTPKSKNVCPVTNIPSNRTIVREPASSKMMYHKKEPASKQIPSVISDTEDPATKVRELYEKIQKQQLTQMASLVEKQKREQMLLQQVFEEQNSLLFKQLKTICPKSPIEAKEAWGDKAEGRGPVSLSQLINHNKSPTHSVNSSPVSHTLTETNCYINQCDNVLRRSRDITNSIKKLSPKARSLNGSKVQTPQSHTDGSRTRTHSPTQRNASRKLNYDSAASSDREYDPMLTDRTNDTLADLNNITFPSDSEDSIFHSSVTSQPKSVVKRSPVPTNQASFRSTDSAIRCLEDTIQNSMNTMNIICNNNNHKNNSRMGKQHSCFRPPTAKEREAATRIVANAKGYLVRRLMRTERVQTTVQTIRDALLCALQLHQDREGIRGADVDLHRRLIQQITAACYNLHDTFVASSPAERCAMIAADRGRRRSIAARQPAVATPRSIRHTDV